MAATTGAFAAVVGPALGARGRASPARRRARSGFGPTRSRLTPCRDGFTPAMMRRSSSQLAILSAVGPVMTARRYRWSDIGCNADNRAGTTPATAEGGQMRARWVLPVIAAGTLIVAVPSGAHGATVAPITCGATITVDTRLRSDLRNCPGIGIVIGADDVRLNLNGHVVDGDGIGDFEGIQ